MTSSRLRPFVFSVLAVAQALGCASLAQTSPSSPAANPGGLRHTIVVADFENRSNWRGQVELGHQLGVVLTDVLHASQHFIVLGESDLRAQSLEEQDLVASGRATSGNNTPETEHLTAAQLIIRGAITHVQHDTASDQGGFNLGGGRRISLGSRTSEINVTFYIVDSTTGQVVASKSVEASSKGFKMGIQHYQAGEYALARNDNLMKALIKAAEDAADWLSSQMDGLPWQGQVVQVAGDKVYINRGTREGVRAGLQLVAGLMKVIRDPTTGEVLDRFLEREVATLEVESPREKLSICRVLSGDIRAIRPNLTVTLPGSH